MAAGLGVGTIVHGDGEVAPAGADTESVIAPPATSATNAVSTATTRRVGAFDSDPPAIRLRCTPLYPLTRTERRIRIRAPTFPHQRSGCHPLLRCPTPGSWTAC